MLHIAICDDMPDQLDLLIACCEYKNHVVLYTLLGGEQVETTTLTESFAEHIAPLMWNERFLSPHISSAINMSWVEKQTREGFTRRVWLFVPMSAKQFTPCEMPTSTIGCRRR